jgi:TPR repeat protein
MKNTFLILLFSLLFAPLAQGADIKDHQGLQMIIAQLQTHQRITPEFISSIRPQAERGDKGAILAMALAHVFDRGIPPNEAESIRWIEKAWRAGDVDVVYAIGMMYKNGELYPRDAEKSYLWISRAMEMGSPDARYFVALAKEKGLGIAIDSPSALKLYQEGAAQRHPLSLMRMGFLHREGKIVAKSPQLALEYWNKGAETGDPILQTTLGFCYLRQPEFFPTAYPEMPKDDVEAYKWLTLAATAGTSQALKLREMAERRMSSAEIARAKEMAASFKPSSK